MSVEHRRRPRHRCSVQVELLTHNRRRCAARVVDISEIGMCVAIDPRMDVRVGDIVAVSSEELGYLAGRVRWQRQDRIGVELQLSTDTRAKLEAYQRNFLAAAAQPEGA